MEFNTTRTTRGVCSPRGFQQSRPSGLCRRELCFNVAFIASRDTFIARGRRGGSVRGARDVDDRSAAEIERHRISFPSAIPFHEQLSAGTRIFSNPREEGGRPGGSVSRRRAANRVTASARVGPERRFWRRRGRLSSGECGRKQSRMKLSYANQIRPGSGDKGYGRQTSFPDRASAPRRKAKNEKTGRTTRMNRLASAYKSRAGCASVRLCYRRSPPAAVTVVVSVAPRKIRRPRETAGRANSPRHNARALLASLILFSQLPRCVITFSAGFPGGRNFAEKIRSSANASERVIVRAVSSRS